jgi:Entner-Doudoroff aldolase
MTPDAFLETFRRARASAILRTDDQRLAAHAMEAAVRGGFRVLEFTMTVPGALELIQEFSRRADVVVGAGTVLEVEQARDAVRAGARYLVSPVVDEQVIAAARALDVAVMPGAHTPTELLRAHRAGAGLQKLFPCPHGGPTFLRSVMGPLPFLRVVPTNGVDASNARAWLEAGAFALGFVGSLFDPAEVAARAWDRIEARARTILASVAD